MASSGDQMATFEVELKRLKQMNDARLNELADLERRVLAFEAKRLSGNVVHLSNVAAG
jgi:hypothetical protein